MNDTWHWPRQSASHIPDEDVGVVAGGGGGGVPAQHQEGGQPDHGSRVMAPLPTQEPCQPLYSRVTWHIPLTTLLQQTREDIPFCTFSHQFIPIPVAPGVHDGVRIIITVLDFQNCPPVPSFSDE